MDNVIIVESPSKSKTIATYLGNGYTVLSSKGHICDLLIGGKNGLGIDIENNFKPNYVINEDKEELVDYLKKFCKGKNVYLATDPDREGEAIAYHLARVLGLDFESNNRIEFHEITKTAVNNALKEPHKIDLKMVDSQETRRIIDRILGFRLSNLLQRRINSKSAGRVQSVALLLAVNREHEILKFIPEPYYELEASYMDTRIKLNSIDGNVINDKNRIKDRSILENIMNNIGLFKVTDIINKQVRKSSLPTFTTSTLQQDASNKLSFSPTRTMSTAQSLYEGKNIGSETVGLITYMRTDSTRLANDFVQSAFDYIEEEFGKDYLGSVKFKSQKNMQDAHEGIRPTDITRNPEVIKKYLTNDEYRLYKLIYNRTLASLMADTIYDSKKIVLSNINNTEWSMHGSSIVFDGYLRVYDSNRDDEQFIPNLPVGKEFDCEDIRILDKFTEPKKRYTEASLVKEMEDLGIGRPSTYAQTIQTLREREYIKVENRTIFPTSQGMLTSERLQEFFSSIINVKYTAMMEDELDKIASGDVNELDELNKFYDSFMPLFENAKNNMGFKYPILTEKLCPKCGNPLAIRLGKFGEFTSCSNYPYCNYIEHDEGEDTGIICPTCGNNHIFKKVSKSGRNKGSVYYACGDYPKCKTSFNDKPTTETCPNCGSIMLEDSKGNLYCSQKCDTQLEEEFICPNCGVGHFVYRENKRYKNRPGFYSCSNYPTCKTILPGKPTKEVCPNCGKMMVDVDGTLVCMDKCTEKKEEIKQVEGDFITCPKCGKGHLIERTSTKGKNKGQTFYGCSNFPRCKNIVTKEEYDKLNNKA
jgi:DNA topoisomerase-1